MNYTNGIWMSISPLSGYAPSIQKAQELPPVEDFYPSEDYPKSLTTGNVRGHTAWIKDLSPRFACGSTAAQDVPTSSTPLATAEHLAAIPYTVAVMYDPTEIASVSWVEGGAVIEVVGPYPAATLAGLADGISFVNE